MARKQQTRAASRRRERSTRTHETGNGAAQGAHGLPRGSIYEVLQRDHQQINRLFDELAESEGRSLPAREDLFLRLRNQIDFHSRAEESTFYSQLKPLAPTRLRTLESVEEHHVGTMLLGELDAMPKDHPRWLPKLGVLREIMRWHIDQEEHELFPAADAILDQQQARQIAHEFLQQKDAWMELQRRSPAAAGVVRGLTQAAERLPFGGGMVATMVNGNPEAVTRVVSGAQRVLPRRPRRMVGRLMRAAAWPVTLPLALVTR